MSWFTKIAVAVRNRGQLPMGIDEIFDDPYSRKHKNPRSLKKKDLFQGSLGFGSEAHDADEQSASGPNKGQVNSLSSFNEIDSKLYEGHVMNDKPAGMGVAPREDFRSDTGDSPTGSGAGAPRGSTNDPGGDFEKKYTPHDSTPQQVAKRNNLNFQNRPSKRRVSYNGHVINVN